MRFPAHILHSCFFFVCVCVESGAPVLHELVQTLCLTLSELMKRVNRCCAWSLTVIPPYGKRERYKNLDEHSIYFIYIQYISKVKS